MNILYFIVMVGVGFVGSFLSGLLGIGGAIINYPLLLFVPPAFRFTPFTAHDVAEISMFQVLFSSLAGVLSYRIKGKSMGLVNKALVTYMGTSILFGSLIGGLGSGYLHGNVINISYGVLAIIAVVLMLIPNRGTEAQCFGELTFNKWIAVISAFVVGLVAGVVGAGGAFILIPIMLTVLKIPTRVTIASSLAIVFISAIGGVMGKLAAGDIPYVPIFFTVLGALLGAPLGSKVSAKMNLSVLRYALVLLIALTAIKVWSSIL